MYIYIYICVYILCGLVEGARPENSMRFHGADARLRSNMNRFAYVAWGASHIPPMLTSLPPIPASAFVVVAVVVFTVFVVVVVVIVVVVAVVFVSVFVVGVLVFVVVVVVVGLVIVSFVVFIIVVSSHMYIYIYILRGLAEGAG